MKSAATSVFLLAYCKRFTPFLLACVLIFAGATGAKEEATTQSAPQQGVELLFPAGTGKLTKDAKLSKEQKKAVSLFKKIKAIEKGGNINATDKSGQTALMHAAAQGNMAAVCWLVAKGADVTIKNKSGMTADDVLLKFLKEQGEKQGGDYKRLARELENSSFSLSELSRMFKKKGGHSFSPIRSQVVITKEGDSDSVRVERREDFELRRRQEAEEWLKRQEVEGD